MYGEQLRHHAEALLDERVEAAIGIGLTDSTVDRGRSEGPSGAGAPTLERKSQSRGAPSPPKQAIPTAIGGKRAGCPA